MSEPRVLGGRYELGEVVGRGGMAEVHRGRDVRLEREVAVKTLRTDLARDPTFQARFRREAQSAAQLNHPAVVAVYDTGEDHLNGVAAPYIVMEYVEGQTLRDLLNDTQRLMPDRALEIISGVLKALAYSHRMGIIHRDIKPANVMLTQHGEIKVMDFGIARSVSDAQATMTQTAQVIGTAQYLSPEQARGEKVDARSDLYSTGCVLYELLTGRPPFSGDSPVSVAYQHVREDPIPPSRLNPDIPPAVDAIVLKSLAKNPDNRYDNADDMRADVERALGGIPVHATPVLENSPTQHLGPQTAATSLLGAGDRDPYADPDEDEGRKKKSRKAVLFTLLALGLVLAVIGGIVGYNAYLDRQREAALVAVPNVVKKTRIDAQQALEDKNFDVKVQEVFSTSVDKDTVISQTPPAGTRRDPEATTVTLKVSKGEEMVDVPKLEGKSRSEAEKELEKAGLEVGDISRESSEEKKGTVLSTSPDYGESVSKGSKVNLTLSSGTVEVPEVVGKSEAEAKAILGQEGFKVKVVRQETEDGEEGEVLAQSPEGGSDAEEGTRVTITVAKAPEETTPPPTPTATPSESSTCVPQPFCEDP
ncbi:MAG: Stk1 family PASTA domain-containing Ser/Thr kinase [Streptosporangiales bacterium]|nr:Stk1 family PASTA domain-containing Ser/Thr kinase [Streptosporangiales bacterium]